MIVWFLVLHLGNSGGVGVIPLPYLTEQSCKEAGKVWGENHISCIPAQKIGE